MYPIVWEPFGFPISSFGVMLATAFLVGTWITAIRMREEGLDPELATTLLLYAMIGGVGGSKLYFAIDTWLRGGGDLLGRIFAREGITWFGGLIGGFTLVVIGTRLHGVPTGTLASCVAPALALGQALGRVGCFLVGDDYGRVTDAAWGIAFPRGAPPTLDPVHPTQLYETAWLLLVFAWLWRRRRTSPFLFGEYLALAGAGRFVVEVWRVNPRGALGLTEAQWIGLALVLIGGVGWLYWRRRTPAAAPA